MSPRPTKRNETAAESADQTISVPIWQRLCVAMSLFGTLRKQDFQAARQFMAMRYPGQRVFLRWPRFAHWALHQMFVDIPAAMQCLSIARPASNTPMWLEDENPLVNHPWRDEPDARLPVEVDTVVIGAGFTGGALAYHWSKKAPSSRQMLVIEMGDAASGASGRNEGLIVMGRYYKMIVDSVLADLPRLRPDLIATQRFQLARQFAAAYCRAAYSNAELIAHVVEEEGFDCDYSRNGWVQAAFDDDQQTLAESIRMSRDAGFDDWTRATPDETLRRTGMRVRQDAGYSRAAASWHPAKWVWCLLQSALKRSNVKLFTRTRVARIESGGGHYLVHTDRGTIRALRVACATESYTPHLDPGFHDKVLPMQQQAASGDGGPPEMKGDVGISAKWFFTGRCASRVLFGSGGSRLADHEAGCNRPSRFLSKFIAGELLRYFGPYKLHMTNEWSGTVGYTPDEYPIVGSIDGNGYYIIAGMCGSGSAVSFNAGRCIVQRILGIDEDDDYPAAYFAPSRLLDPGNHPWPEIEADM